MDVPKVMVSHAFEDKERFVVKFASNLRTESRIETWLDLWEIAPGESLVEKIYDEGLGEADVVIIILSPVSVEKPWVKEELAVATVKRIKGQCRIIPIVIESCKIPAPLEHLLQLRIKDIKSYERELREIVRAIYGLNEKPPLGSAPPRVEVRALDFILKASRQDNIVFDAIGKIYLRRGRKLIGVDRIV